jgi:hypothetical protein
MKEENKKWRENLEVMEKVPIFATSKDCFWLSG